MWSGHELVSMMEREQERVAEMISMLSPDVEVRFTATHDQRSNHGVDAAVEALEEWLEPWGEYRQTAVEYIEASEDSVVVAFETTARGRASGVETVLPVAQIYSVESGKITKVIEFETVEEALKYLHAP